jgi:hypothetical protein
MSTAQSTASRVLAEHDRTHRSVTWRLMPLLLVCYLFAHLDRINIGFAKMQMSSDLHFSDTVYGFGAGLFFIAYALFGVPSNMALDRVGPRRWIASLMVVWGLLSTGMLWVESARGFYVLRFLLGMAEAGFFPGILVFLNRWYPARRRAQVTALFAIAVPMAGVLGGPLSGAILEHFHDVGSLRGWQWMFLIEGLPVVLLGLVVLKWLPDGFDSVHWLTAEQKRQLQTQLRSEEQRKTITSFGGILRGFHFQSECARVSCWGLRLNMIDQAAHTTDLDFNFVPRQHVHTAFGRAGDQHVAGVQGHEFADFGDQLRNIADPMGGGVFLAQFAVDPQPEAQLIGVGHLVARDQMRPECAETIAAFGFDGGAVVAVFRQAELVDHHIASHMGHGIFQADAAGPQANHHA